MNSTSQNTKMNIFFPHLKPKGL